MKWILAYFIQRFAREPEIRDRALSALDGLRNRFAGHGAGPSYFGPNDGFRETRPQWGTAQTTIELDGREVRTSTRVRSLIWTIGGGVLLIWGLLAAAAYGLWPMLADWVIRITTGVGRAGNLPVNVAEPITSLLYTVRDLGGPVLMVAGIVVGVVIVGVTAIAARVVGTGGRH